MLQVDVAAGEKRFAADLVDVLGRASTGNLAVSPPSIYDALARLAPGARGATAEALTTALHSSAPADALLAEVADLASELDAAEELHIASAAWLLRGFAVMEAYQALLAEAGSPLRMADFAGDPEACRREINAWVAENTADRIRNLLPPGSVTVLTRLVLANAVALDALWGWPFPESATADAPFHAPGGLRSVPTMHLDKPLGYTAAAGYRAVRLAYRGGRLAARVVLPDEGVDPLAALPAMLSPQADGSAPFTETPVRLSLPRFEVSSDVDLSRPLAALGLGSLFQPYEPDLSGIGGPPGDLYITSGVHKAWLSVDEIGTKGAAATGFVAGIRSLRVMAPPIDFTVDRPFLFIVEDTAHGVPVFVARITDPSA